MQARGLLGSADSTTGLRCPMNCRALFSHERVSANARQASRDMRSAPMQAARRSSWSTPIGWSANHVPRTGDRIGRDRDAASQRFELHDAERVGFARKHEGVRGAQVSGQGLVLQQAEELCLGKAASQFGLLRSCPITTLEPGRSSERNASRFFSTAIRPTLTKIGRGRSRSIACSGLNISVSTPRVHMPRFLKPRWVSSAISELVDTIVTAAAEWKRRSAA